MSEPLAVVEQNTMFCLTFSGHMRYADMRQLSQDLDEFTMHPTREDAFRYYDEKRAYDFLEFDTIDCILLREGGTLVLDTDMDSDPLIPSIPYSEGIFLVLLNKKSRAGEAKRLKEGSFLWIHESRWFDSCDKAKNHTESLVAQARLQWDLDEDDFYEIVTVEVKSNMEVDISVTRIEK